jgi:hypothetical protein
VLPVAWKRCNPLLLNALPSLSIDRKTILEALQDSRAER